LWGQLISCELHYLRPRSTSGSASHLSPHPIPSLPSLPLPPKPSPRENQLFIMAAASATVKPNVHCLFHTDTFTCTYIVSCPNTSKTIVVDPVMDYDAAAARTGNTHSEKVVAYIEENKLDVELIAETHVHADHLTGASWLKDTLSAKTAIGAHVTDVQVMFKALFNLGDEFKTDGSQFDILYNDGDKFTVGDLQCSVIHTPGHTPACVTYVIGDAVFTGDTIFMPDFGTARCDFPGGSATALYNSIHEKQYKLPAEYRCFVGHDYPKSAGRDGPVWETTMGAQQTGNKHLTVDTTEEEYVAMRTARDATLGAPRLLLPSLQVNLRNGELPPAESNGTSYLKLPVNVVGGKK